MLKSLFSISLLLILTGLLGYSLAEPDPEYGRSLTAFIPSFFGLGMLICGLFSLKTAWRKHAMHAALLIALLGAIGAGARVGKVLENPVALGAHVAMIALCLLFIVLGINSFIKARKAWDAAGGEPSA